MKSIKSRTIALFTIWIMLLGTIIHVVERDLLGIYPNFDLTSAVLMTFAGGVLLLLPSILRSDFQPILGRDGESGSKADLLDLKTLIISMAIFLGVALGIHYSGLISRFVLGSALNTLWMGSVMMLIIAFAHRIRTGKRMRNESAAKMEAGSTTDT